MNRAYGADQVLGVTTGCVPPHERDSSKPITQPERREVPQLVC